MQADDVVEVQMVSGAGAVAFVAVASLMLILLYLFLNHIFALVLVGTSAFQATAEPFILLTALKINVSVALLEVS